MISMDYSTSDDIALWMHLVQKVSDSFRDLEAGKARTEHRQKVRRL